MRKCLPTQMTFHVESVDNGYILSYGPRGDMGAMHTRVFNHAPEVADEVKRVLVEEVAL